MDIDNQCQVLNLADTQITAENHTRFWVFPKNFICREKWLETSRKCLFEQNGPREAEEDRYFSNLFNVKIWRSDSHLDIKCMFIVASNKLFT